jgi:monoterpene epsilon-lactone hydrolase
MQDQVDRKAAKPASPVPKWTGKDVTVTKTLIQGVTCYTLTPNNPSGQHVLYLHGGSYTFEISPIHYWSLGRVARESLATFTIVIYPLAPTSTADQTVPVVVALATELSAAYPDLIIAGDSAGGGMTLAVAERLVAAGVTTIKRIILISPWLDVTMTNPTQDSIVPRDLMLDRQGLIDAGLLYAGPLDPFDPLVSPVYGEVTGLPPITMFGGTNDMLLADAHFLVTKAKEAGVPMDFYEQAGGQHAYPLLPTREGKAARTYLAEVLKA